MSIRTSFLKGGIRLGAGQVVTQVCTFARSVILARLISPEDFGIAATFAMTYSLLDMMSHLAADVQLVQASDGDMPIFQRTAQAVQASRGFTSAIVLFAIAVPVSRLFGVPQAAWAFLCLPLIPLIRGLVHLDINRLQRDMNFGPTVAADAGSTLLSTLAVIPLALWRRDYSAMLWLLIIQTTAYVAISHATSKRKYGWAWDPHYVRRILSFGWPLLINGLLMYGIFQGDRFVIGVAPRLFAANRYTLADLGVYSVAFSLTMAPSTFMSNITSQLFLPLLARAQNSRDQFEHRYEACSHMVCIFSVMTAIPFLVAGSWMIKLIYGPRYFAASGYVGWVAAMFALRLLRIAPTLAAMALGDTRNAMVSNMVRTIALGGVLLVAAANGPLWCIAACGFTGELAALLICVWRLRSYHRVPAGYIAKPFALSALGCVVAALAAAGAGDRSLFFTGVLTFIFVAFTMGMMIVAFPQLRRECTSALASHFPQLRAAFASSSR